MQDEAGRTTLHASCVAVDGCAILLLGTSGSGKSATALSLIAHGAVLISDDQVDITVEGGKLIAHRRAGYEGMIEARGMGILEVASQADCSITIVVDLDQTELQRLPMLRKTEILGVSIDTVYGRNNWLLVPGLMAMARGKRINV